MTLLHSFSLLKVCVLRNHHFVSESIFTIFRVQTSSKMNSKSDFCALTDRDDDRDNEKLANLRSNKRQLEITEDSTEIVKKVCSYKKKKFAMLLSYCGNGYLGMQFNQGCKTIEGELFQAFLKAGIVEEQSAQCPQIIHFQRAARTDKGVSAARQIISFKTRFLNEGIVKNINSFLPSGILVHAFRKATGGFNCKTACDARSYAYLVPTFAFEPKELVASKSFRIKPEILVELNSVLSQFKGTHNFHNFTSGRSPQDPSCKRYMIHCSSGQPYLLNDIEFVKISIKGQSFMLHQIRKMIGLTISQLRGFSSKQTLENAFKMGKVNIPIAPSLNLILDEPHYDSYNRRYGTDGIHEPLEWSSFSTDIDKFCSEFILPVILDGEMPKDSSTGSMAQWLNTLSLHTFEFCHDSIKTKVVVNEVV